MELDLVDADDGLAADLVEGLGAIPRGVDAGHVGLQMLVRQQGAQGDFDGAEDAHGM